MKRAPAFGNRLAKQVDQRVVDARVADARGCEKKSHDSGAVEVRGYLAMLVGGSITRDRNVLTRSGKGLAVNAYD